MEVDNIKGNVNHQDEPLMVTIRCITYNHEPYIRQCLDGFVMQKTNFRFEAIVHDDASTDGTATVIREYAEKYPDIIKPIYETENQYSKHDGSLRRIMDAHMHGKYIAMCEGDDYWTDPLKLQKQVDFLEMNPEYGLVHSNFTYYIENRKLRYIDEQQSLYNSKADESNRVQLMKDILNDNKYRITTVTAMFRKSIYSDMISKNSILFSPHFLMGDTQLWVGLISVSKVHYFRESMAVYRKHEGSATFERKTINVLRFQLSVSEMRYLVSSHYECLKGETRKYENNLRNYLCKYLIVNPNYSSFVVDLLGMNDVIDRLKNRRRYSVLRIIFLCYYQIVDVLRFLYRKVKRYVCF